MVFSSYTGPSASETRALVLVLVYVGVLSSISKSGVTAGVYGDADSVAQVTVNAQGQITDASNVDIAITSSNPDLESTEVINVLLQVAMAVYLQQWC